MFAPADCARAGRPVAGTPLLLNWTDIYSIPILERAQEGEGFRQYAPFDTSVRLSAVDCINDVVAALDHDFCVAGVHGADGICVLPNLISDLKVDWTKGPAFAGDFLIVGTGIVVICCVHDCRWARLTFCVPNCLCFLQAQ